MVAAAEVFMSPALPPPTKLQRIQEAEVANNPRTVCHYKGVTYVGLNGGKVCKINSIQANSFSEFANFNEIIVGIIAHSDRLYMLKYGTPDVVFVYGLQGQQLLKWDFEIQTSTAANAMAIVGDQLLLADNTNACIAIYTLNGEKQRSIPCSLIGEQYNSLCGCGPDAVVIAHRQSDKIFRVKLSTGEVTWTSDAVEEPVGVCQYGDKYILVTTHDYTEQVKVWILDSKSGEQTTTLYTCVCRELSYLILNLHCKLPRAVSIGAASRTRPSHLAIAIQGLPKT